MVLGHTESALWMGGLAHYMTVQSALPRAHPRPADHGLATRPIHEIALTVYGSVGCRLDV
eukprot:1981152-Prymnesium_polylepis.1